jgi:transcription initiation factor IIE alpha subunit
MASLHNVITVLEREYKISERLGSYSRKIKYFLRRKRTKQKLVNEVAPNAYDVVRYLIKTANEDEIAEMLSCKVSEVRATLNKLHALGIVKYERVKHQKTGWYYYFWIIDEEKFFAWFEEEESRWQQLLSQEFYACPVCGLDSAMPFEKAFEHSFKCPICDRDLELVDERFIKRMR